MSKNAISQTDCDYSNSLMFGVEKLLTAVHVIDFSELALRLSVYNGFMSTYKREKDADIAFCNAFHNDYILERNFSEISINEAIAASKDYFKRIESGCLEVNLGL
jgi:hypothetical protein